MIKILKSSTQAPDAKLNNEDRENDLMLVNDSDGDDMNDDVTADDAQNNSRLELIAQNVKKFK